MLTPGRAALSGPRAQTVGKGCLRLTIRQNQNEPVKEKTPLLPLFIFPGIQVNVRELLFKLPSDPEKEQSSEYGLSNCTYPLSHCKILGWTSPRSEFGCVLAEVSLTVEGRFSFEEFSSQTQLSFHMDELSPATNHKTLPGN